MSTILNDTSAIKTSTLFGVAGNDAAKAAERPRTGPKGPGAKNLAVPGADVQISDHGRLNLHGTSGIQTENAMLKGQVRDAGIADNLINLAKSQILNQTGASALGSAGRDAQAVLGMIRHETPSAQIESAAAKGQVRDANIADELINLAKSQILNQTGASALGPVNKDPQTILSLLI